MPYFEKFKYFCIEKKTKCNTMKYLLFLLILLNCFVVNAQKKDPIWFNLEPKIGIAATWLINNNTYNDQNIKPINMNLSLVFGAGLGIQFTKKFCTQIEVLKASYRQSYNYENSVSPKNNVKINTTDLVFVARGTSEKMSYAGLGFKQSFVSNVADVAVGNKTADFNKNFTSILLDLGSILFHNNIFDINLNIRLGYALSDAGKNSSIPFYQPGRYATAVYDSYKATNPASVQITLNFNWHVGYFATAKCKQKKGFVFFEY